MQAGSAQFQKAVTGLAQRGQIIFILGIKLSQLLRPLLAQQTVDADHMVTLRAERVDQQQMVKGRIELVPL